MAKHGVELDVVFIGTAGSAPTARRALPATLVRRGGDRLLFDCGEGTQRQLLQSIGLVELEHVFLTHFHADHWVGLRGLMKTFSLRGRERPLTVYGPRGLKAVMGAMAPVIGRNSYPVELVELEPGQEVERDGYLVAPFAADHRVPAFGYAIVEDERPGEFDDARARELGVEFGPDFGRLARGEVVNGVEPSEVVGPPRPGRKVVLSGDTAPSELTAAIAHDADLLVHEAAFLEEDADRAAETKHSTARGAAQVAADAGVHLLALTHVSPRYAYRQLLAEARPVFERTIVPRDFDRVEIPYPERGAPIHHREPLVSEENNEPL
jgi:ribonuclease Z